MICPSCGHHNLPGTDECARCMFDLASLDQTGVQDRIEATLLTQQIEALHPTPPVTISEQATLAEALQKMIAHEIGAVLVTDEQSRLVGILTERDFLTKIVGLVDSYPDRYVRDFCTPSPETVHKQDSLAMALQKMDLGGYRHLPVVAEGRPVGIISVRDVLRYVTRLCKDY